MGSKPIDNIMVFCFYKIIRFSRDDVNNICDISLKVIQHFNGHLLSESTDKNLY